jgi:hypothetical protein
MSDTHAIAEREHEVEPPDPQLVFLHRAAARLKLVDAGDMDLDEAIGGLVEAFEQLIGQRMLCHCEREIAERLERTSSPRRFGEVYHRRPRGVAA